ncbi:MAG: sigma-70 family RNA polymerase sigma factor [Bacteroidales bacterium]|nr:sigma-70 family RNA polymerase sigma factor [Bacteroidales bacterium]
MGDEHHDIEALRNERYVALLRTFRRHIEHYCARHSNSREDAEDMMQEVFITVWENIDGLNVESSPRQVNRWLQRVMRTVFVRQIRRHRIDSSAPLSEAAHLAQTDDYDRELLESLIAHLAEDERELLQERFKGYSNIEIAERLGIRVNTLNKRMSRIVTKLKDIYNQNYETEQRQ